MRVLILGDLHGRHDALPDILRNARRDCGVSACIQVGDFGWNAACLQRFACLPLPVYAIDGNHDDHDFLAAAVRRRQTATWASSLGLHYVPRGSLLELNGVPIGCLGGALHAHAPQETPSNFVTAADVQKALRTWRHRRPPVIITHSCPPGIGIGMKADPQHAASVDRYCRQAGHDPGPDGDCGEPGLGALWAELDWRPKEWCFGHFHTLHQESVEGTAFTCVGSGDGTDGSPSVRAVVLDLSDPLVPRVIVKPSLTL